MCYAGAAATIDVKLGIDIAEEVRQTVEAFESGRNQVEENTIKKSKKTKPRKQKKPYKRHQRTRRDLEY